MNLKKDEVSEWVKEMEKVLTDPNMQSEVGAKQAMIEALTLYAEQAIDTCAEKAEATESGYYSEDVYLSSCYVDKQSILNVKKLLK